MATKKNTLKEKTPQELTELLTKKREELRDMRFGSVAARLKDVNGAKKTRAEIARIMTELGARKG